MNNFKVIIKEIKPRIKELDPIKIEALKEKRRLQREARKLKPKEEKPKEEKEDKTEKIENINKTIKNLTGLSIDELNAKLNPVITTIQVGEPVIETVIKKTRKKK